MKDGKLARNTAGQWPGYKPKRFLSIVAAIIFAASLIGGPFSATRMVAQLVGTGTIEGTVQDSSGAVVRGATVTATNDATGLKSSQATSSAGSYTLAALPPGVYTVDVQAAGFGSFSQEHVTLDALTQLGLNIVLKVGSNVQRVVVSAAPAELQTENGEVETTIPNSTYSSLPLAMNNQPKNPIGFLSLVPGINNGPTFGEPVFNGATPTSSLIYTNGLPIASSELQGGIELLQPISTEDIDQFQVISSGVPANYDGQGIANLVFKSGTNHIHGSVYENIRNTAFDAAGYFNRSGKTAVEHQNEYGFTVGGPIKHDRIFYFGTFDGFKITSGSNPTYQSIPTPAEQTGDFSALLNQSTPDVIYNPATTVCTGGVCTRQPFKDNQVPVTSSVAKSLQSYLPAPQNDLVQNNYFNTYTNGSTQKMYLAKGDAKISNSNRATFLFNTDRINPISVGALLPLPYSSARSTSSAEYYGQISDTQVITPNLLNVFGMGFIRSSQVTTNLTATGDYPSKAGLTGLPPGQPSTAFPSISFGGPYSPTGWANSNVVGFAEIMNSYTYQDNVQWIHGKHSMSFGTQLVFEQEALEQPSFVNGINFSNSETAGFNADGSINSSTGNAYASFLLGLVDNASAQENTVVETGGRWKNYAVYAQDDWKVTPKFTVNIGLRYSIPKPFVEDHDRWSFLNPTLPNAAADGAPGILQFAGNGPDSCHCRTNVKTHYLTFGPRVGFAYSLDNTTVIRSAFSMVHYNGGALGGNGEQQGVGLLGYSAAPSYTSPDSGVTPAFNLDTGFPAYQHPPFFDPTLNTGYTTTIPAGGGISYDRPNTAGRSPYTEEWNLTLEKEFPASVIMSLSYVGTSSHFAGVNGGIGIYSNQDDPKYLALGPLLTAQATPATIAQVQAIFPGVKLPYPNFAGQIGQMLRPFPQYNNAGGTFQGPDPWSDFGTTSYNGLQGTLSKRMSQGLYFLVSYAWSRTMDEGGQTVNFVASSPRSAYRLGAERTVSALDIPNQLSVSEVYALPFGRGHRFGGENRVVSGIIGGWQFSGIEQYSSGTPLGTITGNCYVPFMGSGCYADYNPLFHGNPRINGKIGSGHPSGTGNPPGSVLPATQYLDFNAFKTAANFTFGNTPRELAYSSLRNQVQMNESFSLAKTFPIKGNLNFQFKADAFNVFNRTMFGGVNTNLASGPTSFGTVNGQSNSPRQLQFEGYLRF